MNETPTPDDAADEDAQAALVERYLHLLPAFAAEFPALPEVSWPMLSRDALADRARGCLLGLALAEAWAADATAGAPEPGHWGAGTAMALCLAQTLQRTPGGLDQYDLAERLRRWQTEGENSASGRCVGLDDETRDALDRFAASDEPASGLEGDGRGGPAALTRLAPVAIAYAFDPDRARLLVQKQARTTHGAREGLDACELHVLQLIDALNGASAAQATRPRVMNLVPRVLALNGGEGLASRPDVAARPDTVDTLRAALWAVTHTTDYTAAVRAAIDLGANPGVVALAGHLAGALYGAAGLPANAVARLPGRERLIAQADALHAVAWRYVAA